MLPSARISRLSRAVVVALLALAGAQCSVERTPAPSLLGPSERALATVVTASPDQLPRDGVSQSIITVVARDANAQPLVGQAFDIVVNPATVILSAEKVLTGADGVATFAITTLPPGGIAPDNTIVVSVLPVGTNAAGNVHVDGNVDQRSVRVRLLGPSNTTRPTAAFTVSPSTKTEIGAYVTFDASGSMDEGVVCGDACTYLWSFGDGSEASGAVVSHQFVSAGIFEVTLVVTDASGATGTKKQAITVELGTVPTAVLTCSPSDPVPNQLVVCDAAGSTADVKTGATIVSYEFSWGDGSTNTSSGDPQASHPGGGYALDGTYTVRVTVTDNYGRTGTATAQVTVATPE